MEDAESSYITDLSRYVLSAFCLPSQNKENIKRGDFIISLSKKTTVNIYERKDHCKARFLVSLICRRASSFLAIFFFFLLLNSPIISLINDHFLDLLISHSVFSLSVLTLC